MSRDMLNCFTDKSKIEIYYSDKLLKIKLRLSVTSHKLRHKRVCEEVPHHYHHKLIKDLLF